MNMHNAIPLLLQYLDCWIMRVNEHGEGIMCDVARSK